MDPFAIFKQALSPLVSRLRELERDHRAGQREALKELDGVLDELRRVEEESGITDQAMMDMVGRAQARFDRLSPQVEDKDVKAAVEQLQASFSDELTPDEMRDRLHDARKAVGVALGRL